HNSSSSPHCTRHARCDRALTSSVYPTPLGVLFSFFTDPPTTAIYTLSLHDALPISLRRLRVVQATRRGRLVRRSWRPLARSSTPDRKSTRLNSSHVKISYAVFCSKKKTTTEKRPTATQ